MVCGISLKSWLLERSRDAKYFIFPISVDIFPIKWLWDKFKDYSAIRPLMISRAVDIE